MQILRRNLCLQNANNSSFGSVLNAVMHTNSIHKFSRIDVVVKLFSRAGYYLVIYCSLVPVLRRNLGLQNTNSSSFGSVLNAIQYKSAASVF